MRANRENSVIAWRESINNLPWDSKSARGSATLALSKAAWHGIDQEEAIRTVFELAMGGFFHENPHIPYQIWQSVSAQIRHRDELALLAA
jgi:hypothetical protein